MDHTEAIVQINNLIDHNFCNEMIKFMDQKSLEQMKTFLGTDKSIRNVLGYTLDFQSKDKIISDKIIKKIEKLYSYYKAKFFKIQNLKISQIDLLKYNVGGKYGVHVDIFTNVNRQLSVIINLNDDYKGGNLIFTDQKEKEIKRLKLGKGSIVFFPSNFMYPHEIQPITKGTRYSIVAWLY